MAIGIRFCARQQLEGQVDLAETDENGNENERGNENEKGNGRQEGSKCGIGRRSCKPTLLCKIVWCIQRLVTGSRQAAHASYINYIVGQHMLKVCLSGVWQDLASFPGLSRRAWVRG